MTKTEKTDAERLMGFYQTNINLAGASKAEAFAWAVKDADIHLPPEFQNYTPEIGKSVTLPDDSVWTLGEVHDDEEADQPQPQAATA